MVSRLFKIKKPVDEIKPGTEYFNKSEFIKLGRCPNFKDWCMSWIPKRCIFCKKSRHEIAMSMAREKLCREINIIEIVKSWRYFENAFNYLIPEKKRLSLKEYSRYLSIDPDNADKIDKRSFTLKHK